MKLLASVVANGVALWVASAIVSGIEFGGRGLSQLLTILGVALVFGLVNAVVRPLVQLLSLPLIVLTLGLFLIIVNALMLLLTSWLSGVLGLSFSVDDLFWSAILGSIIISIVSLFVSMLLPDGRDRA
ncbi:phage holin family protein [uncultured Serinicoccus sp.]|uniref:phage holin family protein n=1 Tax=uncultured Serinicoccus sp. TaxID=735514 RepID=UPI00261FAA77|nr:phage holin family protein [uncultured Serinicoccus sp.]